MALQHRSWLILAVAVLLHAQANVASDHEAELRAANEQRAADIIAKFNESRDDVEAKWSYAPDLMCMGAGLHGRVEKQVTGKALFGLPTMIRPYVEAGIPIYCGIQLYVSHVYKVIYIRQPKSSSSSILAAMHFAFCGGHNCSPLQLTQLRMPNESMWREYFVFTAVRNPYARMVSAYNMFSMYLRRKDPSSPDGYGPRCQIPFSSFANNSFALRTTCTDDQCCSYLKSYGRFVEDFVNGHISQQAHAVFTPQGQSAVDYIARTENIAEDWDEILDIVRNRTGLYIPPTPMRAARYNSSNDVPPHLRHPCLSPKVVELQQLNASTMHAIARQYAMDITMLKFWPQQSGGTLSEGQHEGGGIGADDHALADQMQSDSGPGMEGASDSNGQGSFQDADAGDRQSDGSFYRPQRLTRYHRNSRGGAYRTRGVDTSAYNGESRNIADSLDQLGPLGA